MTIPTLPSYQSLGPPKGAVVWEVPLETVTPVYGGGARTRRVDQETPVRAPSIRGQLRFWWRALYGGRFDGPQAMFGRERALFGGLADNPDELACSRVALSLHDLRPSDVEDDDVTFVDPAAYALWPARATAQGEAPAQRWAPGIRFTLVMRLMPRDDVDRDRRELERTLRAWLLFGGVGGRTRRGCGSLGIPDEAARAIWLPDALRAETIADWLSPQSGEGRAFPSLSGARLRIGRSQSPYAAWISAINWLRDFRQGANPFRVDTDDRGPFARQRPYTSGRDAKRYGRSRWPEPDQIRREYDAHDHDLLIPAGAPSTWPRAQFGLPIQFRFQDRDRAGGYFRNRPPPPGALGWAEGGRLHQRLASPLILKPIQARGGQFAGAALWLDRRLPADATVGIEDGDRLRAAASVDAFPASALFTHLDDASSTAEAFMGWLERVQRLSGGVL